MQLMTLSPRTVPSVESSTKTQSPETAFYIFLGTVRLLGDCWRGGAPFLNPSNTLILLLFRHSIGTESVQKILLTTDKHS